MLCLDGFSCHDLLQLMLAHTITPSDDPAAAAAGNAIRFFGIAKRLPMEVQMIVCHRVVGSAKDSILSRDSEAAFKALAVVLLSPPPEVFDDLSSESSESLDCSFSDSSSEFNE